MLIHLKRANNSALAQLAQEALIKQQVTELVCLHINTERAFLLDNW